MRAPFNDVVSVYDSPLSPVPGLLLGTFPCRYVPQTDIQDLYPFQGSMVAWFTCPESLFLTYAFSTTADSFTINLLGCEQLVFDSLPGEVFIPVTFQRVAPWSRPAYHRYGLVNLASWPFIPDVTP